MREDESKEQFWKRCRTFDADESFEDYVRDIHCYLMLSSWHYSDESANETMRIRMNWIEEAYKEHDPVDDIAVEVGYWCG